MPLNPTAALMQARRALELRHWQDIIEDPTATPPQITAAFPPHAAELGADFAELEYLAVLLTPIDWRPVDPPPGADPRTRTWVYAPNGR